MQTTSVSIFSNSFPLFVPSLYLLYVCVQKKNHTEDETYTKNFATKAYFLFYPFALQQQRYEFSPKKIFFWTINDAHSSIVIPAKQFLHVAFSLTLCSLHACSIHTSSTTLDSSAKFNFHQIIMHAVCMPGSISYLATIKSCDMQTNTRTRTRHSTQKKKAKSKNYHITFLLDSTRLDALYCPNDNDEAGVGEWDNV